MTTNDKILKHYKLIYLIMNELHCYKNNEDEYFFYGLMGLYRGIKSYDSSKGIKETTYYSRCIKNEILARFNYKTRKKRNNVKYEISINTPIDENHTIEDILVSDIDIEEELIKKEQLECIYKALEDMKDTKYKKYICDYFGVNCKPLKTYQIAEKYNVTHQNISQSIKQGIEYLKKKVKKEYEKQDKKIKIKN